MNRVMGLKQLSSKLEQRLGSQILHGEREARAKLRGG